MKRILFLALFALVSLATWAAKANSMPVTVNQPDGTQLTIRGFGDEHLSWITTLDGVMLAQTGNGYYVASIDNNGNMTATAQLAHEPAQRSEAEIDMIAKQDKDAFFAAANQRMQRKAAMMRTVGTATPAYFPHTGSPKAVVILVEFSDVKFTVPNPQAEFDQYLNGTAPLPDNGFHEGLNHGSVKQYFTDMSFGTFTPQFDVYGPVSLNTPSSYYGADSGNNKDLNYAQLIKDACVSADGSIDFSQYVGNDNAVDLVYIIYAGYGQSVTGTTNDIWPKSGTVGAFTLDGKTISRFGLNNELNGTPSIPGYINGIGLFCHEFSHTMGVPDMYPTNISYTTTYPNGLWADNQEMEYWDLMDGGEYSGWQMVENAGTNHYLTGYCPTPYTAWEREQMGWNGFKLTPLTTTTEGITATPVSDGGVAYKVINPNDANEYMVLENIQNSTGWSSGLFGKGLLVYHVKWNISAASPDLNLDLFDYPNNIVGKPGMAIVPANGLLLAQANAKSRTQYVENEAGNTFPGTTGVNKLEFAQGLPNYKWYTSGPTIKQSLQNITDNGDGTITFDYLDGVTDGINDTPIWDNSITKACKIYTIDGKYVGTNKSALPKGIYIMNNQKVVVK